jgi:ubiquinone/menaquinone biosynthesis C-methylase UbiE
MDHKATKLKLLPYYDYRGVNNDDPLRYYYWPIVGQMYRRRVELCLGECHAGQRVLEVGFGSGLSFLNLHDIFEEIHGLDLTADVSAVSSVFDGMGIHTDLRNGDVLKMPYQAETFDTVLLISILEHLQPSELEIAFKEIQRVLKSGGQVVYGTPVERPFMVAMFRVLGYDIRQAHFSTEKQIAAAAEKMFHKERIIEMQAVSPIFGVVYNVGHFIKK